MKEILNDLRVLWIDIWYNISNPFYRLFKGYAPIDLWGLDYYIAKRILPALKAFRKQKMYGYSGDFKNMKEWLKAIDEMIYGLEFIIKDEMDFITDKKARERAQKGRELFGKYLTHLWD